MILLPPDSISPEVAKTITKANTHIAQAEVILKNLLAVANDKDSCFTIPIGDVLISIETALGLLEAM